jgi:hypothetical protein
MAISAFVFRTRRQNLAVDEAKGKWTFPLFSLLSVIGVNITFLCHCKIPAIGRPTLGSDSLLLAILLSILSATVIYGIRHHYSKKRRIGIGLALSEILPE